jgi:hypothetical protein
MKRALLVVLSLFSISLAAFADQAATASSNATTPRTNAGKLQQRHMDDPAQESPAADALPTISKFQIPGLVPISNVGCGGPDSGPCQDDWGGDGYTQGSCNCSRLCGNGSGCLLSVANNGCQANPYPEDCKPCSGKCYTP